MEAEELALMFHGAYERLAPKFGYDTRNDTRVFDVESNNGKLMLAVCAEILNRSPIVQQTLPGSGKAPSPKLSSQKKCMSEWRKVKSKSNFVTPAMGAIRMHQIIKRLGNFG